MKSQKTKTYIKVVLSVFFTLSVLSPGHLLAQDSSLGQATLPETLSSSPSATTAPDLGTTLQSAQKLLEKVQTQDEVNAYVDDYIKKNAGDTYYTDTTSIGDTKILIQDKYLYVGQKIDFTTVKYNVDKSLDFKQAHYSWQVKRGTTSLINVKKDVPEFYFEPHQTGNYTTELTVDFGNGITKTGIINFTVYTKTNIDFEPKNPSKGDTIILKTDLYNSKDLIDWKVDGKIIAQNKGQITLQEDKGYNSSYTIEAIIKYADSKKVKYYGNTSFSIVQPTLKIELKDSAQLNTINPKSDITIDKDTQVLIKAIPNGFGTTSPIDYIFRVNGEIVSKGVDRIKLDVLKGEMYNISIISTNQDKSKVATAEMRINPKADPVSPSKAKDSKLKASVSSFTNGLQNKLAEITFIIVGILSIALYQVAKKERILIKQK